MSKNKLRTLISLLLIGFLGNAQTMSLEDIVKEINENNPQLKMYEADIRSMDAAADGAKSWMPPQVSTGFFMTPYDSKMWKADGMNPGMGSYMVGIEQMFPNAGRQKAEFNYMRAMSAVEAENRNYTINQLRSIAKSNYYSWLIQKKKLKIATDNLQLLQYMIKSMEIRYEYNMDKLPSYYKAKSQLGVQESMIAMLENDAIQKRTTLNMLMLKDRDFALEIDTTVVFKDFNLIQTDTAGLAARRSDLKAIERTIALNELQIKAEQKKLAPEFGVRYEHMLAFGDTPNQFTAMLMVNLPFAPWSSKMTKATIKSSRLKNESLQWQRQMILNEATAMIKGMHAELTAFRNQYDVATKNIIPALRRNYDTAVIAWQNNTGDLFVVLDAWEALNMAQLDSLDKLQSILNTQVEIEKLLEIE